MDSASRIDSGRVDVNRNIIARHYWQRRFSGFTWEALFEEPGKPPVTGAIKYDRHELIAQPPLAKQFFSVATTPQAQHLLLLSVVSVLAYKCSGVKDLCICTPLYANDPHEGCVPVRVHEFADLNFPAFLSYIKDKFLNDRRYGDYPVDKILKTDLNEELPLVGMVVEGLQPDFKDLRPDILFTFSLSGAVALSISFNTNKYSSGYIQKIGEYFFHLLVTLLEKKELPIRNIEMISAAEKQQVLYGFNNNDPRFLELFSTYSPEDTVVSVFCRQAERNPEKIALVIGEKEYSYEWLNRESDQVAACLSKNYGVQEGSLVGVMLERDENLLTSILGILKTGAAYVPIDPVYPHNRKIEIIKQAGLQLVIAGAAAGIEKESNGTMFVTAESVRSQTGVPDNTFTPRYNKNALAYVLFTSGSTGRPKGVMIRHSALFNYICWAAGYYVNGERGNFPLYTSISFDLTITSIFTPLFTGNKIIIYSERNTDFRLEELLLNKDIDIIKLTPSQLKALSYNDDLQTNAEGPAKKLIVGGENLSYALAKLIHDRLQGHVVIYNEYGPTESTVGCMIEPFNPAQVTLSVPIGHPVYNSMIYLLDENRNPVPACVPGELYISGAGLAAGYLSQQEFTREKFSSNPFVEAQRFYRTGDLAVRDVVGRLIFLGRIDDQIKLRGFRIELGEIESKLLRYPGVQEAVVIAREGADGDKYLAAYYVSGEQVTENELQEHLRAELPEYMVPAACVSLERLPLTSNGKVDRRLLPEPPLNTDNYEAPGNKLEDDLVETWCSVLKTGKELVSVTRSFFELGGHSLKAIELKNRLLKDRGLNLELGELFRYNTIRSLAEYLMAAGKGKYDVAGFRQIPLVEQRACYKLSYAQKRLYFIYEYDRQSLAYNTPQVIVLKGRTDHARLRAALQQLVMRHEILRTRFVFREGGPVQEVLEQMDLDLEQFNVHDKPSFEEEWNAVDEIIRNFVRPFDLGVAPLLRMGLIEGVRGGQVLMVDMHHIITDGVSQGILIDEFLRIYNNEVLPLPALQYKDYAEWQQGEAQTALLERQRLFWLKEYEELPAALNLPVDRLRMGNRSHLGGELTRMLSVEETAGLQQLGLSEQSTMFMMLLSMYIILLNRLSGQDDIVVGTAVSGRRHADVEGIPGMFANTLALRQAIQGEDSFRSLLGKVHGKVLACLENQDYPYEELVDTLKLDRSAGRNPLFDVVFSYEDFHGQHYTAGDLQWEPYGYNGSVSKFDLVFTAWERNKQLALNFSYSKDVFDEATIARFATCFHCIVRAVLKDADVQLKEVDLLPAEEKALLLESFGKGRVDYPLEESITSLFNKQVQRNPDAIALVYSNERLTYSELDQKAGMLAHYLISRGVKPGDLIPLCMPRSATMIISILGILKAGGAYVPIDPKYPRDRIHFILKDIQAAIVLAGDGFVSFDNIPVIKVAGILKHADNTYSGPLPVNGPNALAYVNYTSGSTGNQKGVMIRHKSVKRLLALSDIRMDSSTVTLQLSSISFDATTFEIWASLLNGGTLVIYPYEYVDTHLVNQVLKEHKVNTLWLTSGLFDQWCETDLSGLHLKYLLAGGDVVHPQSVHKLYERLPGIAVYNGYGPTENTTFTTCYKIPAGFNANTIPIGSPLPGTRVYILDRYLQLVPVGVAGELFIAGAGLATGYVNNPDLTNEKFIDNPFVPGDKMYATGDQVRWLNDGNIEFLGRIDDQIKLRGFRIELGEIESRLLSYPGMQEAVVLARERAGSDKYLVAYYAASKPVTEKQLQEYLRAELPEYMMPAAFVMLERLPLTSNGKVDRRLLPEPQLSVEDHEEPVNKLEDELVQIWSSVLKLNSRQVSVTRSFFELGGHSLKAIELKNRLLKDKGVNLDLGELFRYNTVRNLAEYLSGAGKQMNNAAGYRQIPRVEQLGFYQLSSAQKRLYFIYEYDPQSLAYNVPQAIVLKGPVDHERLSTALMALVMRHEILRTRFVLWLGEPVQEVMDELEIGIEKYNIHKVSSQDEERTAVHDIIRNFIRPFDLSEGPLLRMALIEGLREGQVLVVDMHHIITDGVSQGILIEEFFRLYNNEVLPMPALQYKDYAEWQQGNEQRAALERQRLFWLNEYSTLPAALTLPLDRVRAGKRSHIGGEVRWVLSVEETEWLQQLGLSEGSTMYMVLLSVYIILLNRLSGQEELVIGTAVSGRRHSDVERIPGMFINTLALRLGISREQGFRSFLRTVRERVLVCLENQDYPYEELVESLKLDRSTGKDPLFDVAFSYQDFDEQRQTIGELEWEPYRYDGIGSKSDLVLSVWERNGQMALSFSYSKDVFDAATIERFAAYYHCIIQAVMKDAEGPLKNINSLPPQERRLLLETFGKGKKVDHPSTCSIPVLFEEQALRTPDAIAIVAGMERITYSGLNSLSDQLGNYLVKLGVKKEEPVAICMHRSIAMAVGLLGILKAGGAYVPLDPGYPQDRIAYMLQDTAARFVLSDRQHKATLPPAFPGQVIFFEDREWRHAEASAEKENREIHSGQLAYIIYTSGSTGKPKGVMIEHRGVVNLAGWHNRTLEVTDNSKITSMANVSFDAFGIELWPHLLKGACIYMVNDELRLHPGELFNFYQKHGITHSFLPTPLVQGLLTASENKGSSLRCLWTGGDRLQLSKGVQQRFRLLNSYGPAENTVAATGYWVDWAAPETAHLIGTPIDNVDIYIIDTNRQLCGIGIPGQICLGGVSLARGYWNNPELTAEKFTEEIIPGVRIYQTGDLGRWTVEGNIEFLGRIDEQVKIRGQRIEPGEIESRLCAYEGIGGAVVVVKEHKDDKFLVAYYVSEKEIDTNALKEHLLLNLPVYMVPAFFCHLQALPLTPNGKIDRKALPEHSWNNNTGYIKPVNKTQQLLVEIWADLLGIEKEIIGTGTSFFDIGGNSIKLVSLADEINRRFPVKMTITDMFQFTTVGMQARFLDDAAKTSFPEEELTVSPDQLNEVVRQFEK